MRKKLTLRKKQEQTNGNRSNRNANRGRDLSHNGQIRTIRHALIVCDNGETCHPVYVYPTLPMRDALYLIGDLPPRYPVPALADNNDVYLSAIVQGMWKARDEAYEDFYWQRYL